jgi:hypothetical protein
MVDAGLEAAAGGTGGCDGASTVAVMNRRSCAAKNSAHPRLDGTDDGRKHYGKQGLCRAPRAHGQGLKTHGKPFAVRFFAGRTAKGAR